MEGFSEMFDGKVKTVWSAPNYTYRFGNKASVLEVGGGGAFEWNVFEEAEGNKLI